jgi:formate/nitrite transporter FocA (FNT family)
MEHAPLRRVEQLALKKQKVFLTSKLRYILRAMLASMFIGFGVIVAFKTGSFFYVTHSPLTYPMAAITFGVAIILIAYGGGDLFTGKHLLLHLHGTPRQNEMGKRRQAMVHKLRRQFPGSSRLRIANLGNGIV